MARITVEDCLTKENNRFALVQLASKRTKQLLQGSRVLSSEAKGNKAVVTALREIAEGQVRFMTEEDRALVEEMERHKAEHTPVHDLFIAPTNGHREKVAFAAEEEELIEEEGDIELEEFDDSEEAEDDEDDSEDDTKTEKKEGGDENQ